MSTTCGHCLVLPAQSSVIVRDHNYQLKKTKNRPGLASRAVFLCAPRKSGAPLLSVAPPGTHLKVRQLLTRSQPWSSNSDSRCRYSTWLISLCSAPAYNR